LPTFCSPTDPVTHELNRNPQQWLGLVRLSTAALA
jgi:hypothetical protein